VDRINVELDGRIFPGEQIARIEVRPGYD